MLKVFDYECDKGHRTEHFSKGQAPESIECPNCGLPAQRLIAATRCKLDGTTGEFPGAAMQWERKRAEKMAQEQKVTREHGPQKW